MCLLYAIVIYRTNGTFVSNSQKPLGFSDGRTANDNDNFHPTFGWCTVGDSPI